MNNSEAVLDLNEWRLAVDRCRQLNPRVGSSLSFAWVNTTGLRERKVALWFDRNEFHRATVVANLDTVSAAVRDVFGEATATRVVEDPPTHSVSLVPEIEKKRDDEKREAARLETTYLEPIERLKKENESLRATIQAAQLAADRDEREKNRLEDLAKAFELVVSGITKLATKS